MIRGIFIVMMTFSLFGCKTITIDESSYISLIENEPEIKIKTFKIDKNKILLVIENTKYKPFEAYYIDFKKKVFGVSSLTDYKIIKDKKKAIVNKSALLEPPIIGLHKATFIRNNSTIEITVKEPKFDEGVDYSKHMSVFQKKIILRNKSD